MKKIYKYPLMLIDFCDIPMPRGAEIIHVDMQHNTPTLWAIVDPQQPNEQRHFRIIGTGQPVAAYLKHLGTVMHGSFVWHVFEQMSHNYED